MNLVNDIKQLFPYIVSAAPTIASTLLGPEAGIAVSLLCKTFSLQSSNSIGDLIGKINADPDREIKLKQLEADHAEHLMSLTNDHYQQMLENDKNARARELAYLNAGKSDYMMPFLIIILMSAIAGIIYCMLFVNAILANTLSMMLGVLLREIPAIYSYYFGGTQDSQ